jgi:hypothetical protein
LQEHIQVYLLPVELSSSLFRKLRCWLALG